jgi:pimeloyl-ACP methyl ester carboxylesterase
VLLHGFPLSGLTWRRLVPTLSKRFTCYAFDLVGLGDSRSRAAADFSSPGQGAVMRQALRALGVSSYALLGNDTGGWVARETQTRTPQLPLLPSSRVIEPGTIGKEVRAATDSMSFERTAQSNHPPPATSRRRTSCPNG